jgi:hypothetical protein
MVTRSRRAILRCLHALSGAARRNQRTPKKQSQLRVAHFEVGARARWKIVARISSVGAKCA